MTKKKILVADDEPSIRKLIRIRLEANNYKVITARNGEECLKKLISEKPDLVILDIMMSKMDGYITLIAMREMQGIKGKVPKVPVIVLSARADSEVKELIEKENLEDYIIKPFGAEDLLEKIHSALKKKKK